MAFTLGYAHTDRVRQEFSQLFQFKVYFLLEELFSPVITPLVLIFWVRPRARQLVDFFHRFTVDVEGLGDVCSFAQMDIRKHGDPKWNGGDQDTQGTAAANFHTFILRHVYREVGGKS